MLKTARGNHPLQLLHALVVAVPLKMQQLVQATRPASSTRLHCSFFEVPAGALLELPSDVDSESTCHTAGMVASIHFVHDLNSNFPMWARMQGTSCGPVQPHLEGTP